MDLKEFRNLLNVKKKELNDLARRKMPVIVGQMAKSHFQENFRKSGFVNNGLNQWKPSKRLSNPGKSAASNYKTLTSGRNHLLSSIKYIPGDARVTIRNDVEYASIHNEGGTINMPARKQVIHFNKKGKFSKLTLAHYAQKANRKAYSITMPKRQFIGESKELNEKIAARWEQEIEKTIHNS